MDPQTWRSPLPRAAGPPALNPRGRPSARGADGGVMPSSPLLAGTLAVVQALLGAGAAGTWRTTTGGAARCGVRVRRREVGLCCHRRGGGPAWSDNDGHRPAADRASASRAGIVGISARRGKGRQLRRTTTGRAAGAAVPGRVPLGHRGRTCGAPRARARSSHAEWSTPSSSPPRRSRSVILSAASACRARAPTLRCAWCDSSNVRRAARRSLGARVPRIALERGRRRARRRRRPGARTSQTAGRRLLGGAGRVRPPPARRARARRWRARRRMCPWSSRRARGVRAAHDRVAARPH